MRVPFTSAVSLLAALLLMPAGHAQETAGGKTFRALLFHVPGTFAPGLTVERVEKAWKEGESEANLGVWLKGAPPKKLQVLTVTPGQESGVVKYKDLTFRISGLYRGAQKDRMFLKVTFDQGGQAVVKEFLAGLDETLVVTYPLAGEEPGSIVALLIPTE